MDIRNAVVVITGASSGIGRATAVRLAAAGAHVVLAARDRAALEEAAAECGGRALIVPTDMVRDSEVQELARRTIATYGRIDVWINNAGVALFAKFERAPLDAYKRVIETNLFGYIHGARAAMVQFRKQHRGILINIDSVVAGAPQPYTSAYVASKFAVRGWSSCLRMELDLDKEKAIHVCTVMPAAMDTPLFQHAANYTGRAVKALDPVYDAATVAETIADVVESPRAEVMAGKAGIGQTAQYRMSPRMYEKTNARFIERNYFQDEPAPTSHGNLFTSSGPHAVSGGWRESGTMTAKMRWPAAIGGAALGALAVAATIRLLQQNGSDAGDESRR